jgi:molecular chaperone GrpE (heat shock protein)
MRKLQLRDYNYSTTKTKQERTISIELAVFDYSTEEVIQYMTKLQQYHPIIKEDLQELLQRKDELEELKIINQIEKSYFHNKKIRNQINKIYNIIDNYDKARNPNKKTLKWSQSTIKIITGASAPRRRNTGASAPR